MTNEQQQKRDESLNGYSHNGTHITSPGKFEGEPIFAPYYWGVALEGFADSDDGRVFGFRFNSKGDDFVIWHELKRWLGRKRSMKMMEDDQGFVRCF